MSMNPKYESDNGSTATSPKRLLYYVQSPSRDSNNDVDKSSTSAQNTPAFHSPLESPSFSSSYGRHYGGDSTTASSRVSGNWRWTMRGNRRKSGKGWRECKVIDEEVDGDRNSMFEKCLVWVTGLALVFVTFCLIIWGASRPYKTQITVKELRIDNFHYGEGSDRTGVPTRLLTVNCTVSMATHNPATFFGIHVSSSAVNLIFSQITLATGELNEYYQPSKSNRELTVRLDGHKVPLYGTANSIVHLDNNGGIPLKLDFEILSRGYLVGKLVKTKRGNHVTCSLIIKSKTTKHVKLKDSCTQN